MSGPKLTAWFDGMRAVPHYVGLYERLSPEGAIFSWWNGKTWAIGSSKKATAIGYAHTVSNYQSWDFRGLASDPNAS